MSASRTSRWIAIGGFVVFGTLSGTSFLYGAAAVGGVLEDGAWAIPNIVRRCPDVVPSEYGYDSGCARQILARGPLALGEAAFAASFALGLAALGALALRSGPPRLTAAIVLVVYLCGWALLLVWNATEGRGLVENASG